MVGYTNAGKSTLFNALTRTAMAQAANYAFTTIKPNVGWDRDPRHAANTNPEVIAATVEMCLKAGASKVIVSDPAAKRRDIALAIRRHRPDVVITMSYEDGPRGPAWAIPAKKILMEPYRLDREIEDTCTFRLDDATDSLIE